VKPNLVKNGMTADISLLSIYGTLESHRISILVINPDGSPIYPKKDIRDFGILRFPTDFIDHLSSLNGNYTVLLLGTNMNNKSLTSVQFKVLPNPLITSFINFVFGKGLAFTIGGFVLIVPIIYQYLSQQSNDRGRRLESKATWMVDNMKNYIDLYSNGKTICSRFENESSFQFIHNEVDPSEVLFDLIYFYKEILTFKDKTGYYYFDDLESEYFLAKLEDALFDQYNKILGSYRDLKQFFKCESPAELINHKESGTYLNKLKNWISDQHQANDFYLNHLVYYWVLFVNLNKASLVTYTSSSNIKKRINGQIKPYKKQLKDHILKLNGCFSYSKSNYYDLFDWRGRVKL
jgi:hypothetical protein